MKKVLFLVLFASFAFGASLLTLSVNETKEQVEINLAFDGPFDGYIEQNKTAAISSLKLSQVAIDSNKLVELKDNELVSKLIMTKLSPTEISLQFETKKEVSFEALKNNDGYKLQIKVIPEGLPATQSLQKDKKIEQNHSAAPQTKETPTPKEDDSVGSWRYITVLSFLIFLVAVALYIKKRALQFPQLKKQLANQLSSTNERELKDEVVVLNQSFLDPNNKLMLVEYGGIKYLLLVGNTNLVVDRFYADGADLEDEEFRAVLAQNERKLNDFLRPREQLSNFDEYRLKAEGD